MSKKSRTNARVAAPARTKALGDGWKTLESMYGLGQSILRRLSELEALKQGAVSAAVDVLSQDISKARFRMIQESRAGTRVLNPSEHALARRLMLYPNEHHTWHEVMEMLIRHLGTHQNAYLVKIDRYENDPDPDLVPVHPMRVTQQVFDKRFFYDVAPVSFAEAAILGFSEMRRLTADQIIHFRGRMHTGEIGLSTLIIGADVLGLNQALIDFQAGLAKTGLRPNAVISTPENLSDEQFARLKKEIEAMLSEANRNGTPALFEAGMEYKAISRTANDADLHKARQLLRQEVAALWRIPAYKIGAGETEKYDNKQTAEQTYVDDALVPVALRFEAIFKRAVLTDRECLRGISFVFDRDDLYDRDRQMASDRIIKQFDAGIITRGQALSKLGYDAVSEQLDTYKIPVNAAILRKDGTIEYVVSKATAPDNADPAAPPEKSKAAPRPLNS